MILPAKIQLPQNIDDAIKMANSLKSWLEFIKAKVGDAEGSDPFNSYGGNIEAHLAYLNYWFKTEAIRMMAKSLETSE